MQMFGRAVTKRWIAAGVAAGLAGTLYLMNASWLARPTGQLHILAHRGPHQQFSTVGLDRQGCTATRIYPPTHSYLENTIASTRAAFDMGADKVEIDVHPTTDGEFAVFHDWTIGCRTEGKGVTRDQTMAYLRSLDIGYGYTADGGKTFPFRGKGVGLMPTFEEMLRAFPGRRFLVNIKSNDPTEADKLAAYITSRRLDLAPLSFYGGEKPVARLKLLLPTAQTVSMKQSKACIFGYFAWGWTGAVPRACRGAWVPVPLPLRPLYWGYPNRFLARMQAVGADTYIAGDLDLPLKTARGVDSVEQVKAIPKDWKGGVMTDAVEVVGPAIYGGGAGR